MRPGYWLTPGFIQRHGFAGAKSARAKAVSPRLLRKLMGEMVFSSFAGAKPARSKSVSPGLLRKLFWRVTFAWRGKSHQNRADRTRIFRRNYNGIALTEILHSPSLMLDPIWVITPGMHGAAHNYECVLSMSGQGADLRGKSARTKAVRLYSSFTFQRAGLLANPGLVELAQPQIFNCGLLDGYQSLHPNGTEPSRRQKRCLR